MVGNVYCFQIGMKYCANQHFAADNESLIKILDSIKELDDKNMEVGLLTLKEEEKEACVIGEDEITITFLINLKVKVHLDDNAADNSINAIKYFIEKIEGKLEMVEILMIENIEVNNTYSVSI